MFRVLRGSTLLLLYMLVLFLSYLLAFTLVDVAHALALAPQYQSPIREIRGVVVFYLLVLVLPLPLAGLEYALLRWRGRPITAARALPTRLILLGLLTPALLAGVLAGGMVAQPVLFVLAGQGLAAGLFLIFYSPHYRSRLLLLVLTVLLMVGVLEAGTRLIFPQPAFNTWLPYYPGIRYTREVNLKGVQPISQYSTNAWGFRGDPVPRRREDYAEIITIGGSTTQCFYLGDALTYPAQLQATLREDWPSVWVGNAGLDGHTTRG
ncbi:MAG: hypothetical protein MUE40_04160, partial [Anaerolineae bacterium]|nr:hypothetical protein [Anaerolineae bacterium]